MSLKLSYFLIHVSKSMGTSICDTFDQLGFSIINKKDNCNHLPAGVSVGNVINWPTSCDKIKKWTNS